MIASAWAAARRHLADIDDATLRAIDRSVATLPPWLGTGGETPGLTPGSATRDATRDSPGDPSAGDAAADAMVEAFRGAGRDHVRPGFVASTALMTWDFVVLQVTALGESHPRSAFLCLPRSLLGPGMEALDAGALDGVLQAHLESATHPGPSVGVLRTSGQTSQPGIYRGIGDAAALVARERAPHGGGGKSRRDQASDGPTEPTPTTSVPTAPPKPARSGPAVLGAPLILIGLLAAAGVAVGGTLLLAGRAPAPSPSTLPTQAAVASTSTPTVVATPTVPGSSVAPTFLPLTTEFVRGEASIHVRGDAIGDVEGLTFALDLAEPPGGGPAELTWHDEALANQLDIDTASWHATGDLGTTEVGINVFMDVTVDGVADYLSGGGGLGHDAAAAGRECTAHIDPTVTGGITGTFTCSNIADPLDNQVITAAGEFWAEPPGAVGTGEPSTSCAQAFPEFTTGSASVRMKGFETGSAELTFANEGCGGPPEGPFDPVIVWADDSALNVFGLYTLTPHATGALSTDAGTLGLGWTIDKVSGPVPFAYSRGFGLGHGRDFSDVPSCTATITLTPTGGITGSVTCPNANNASGPIRFEATFAAEP